MALKDCRCRQNKSLSTDFHPRISKHRVFMICYFVYFSEFLTVHLKGSLRGFRWVTPSWKGCMRLWWVSILLDLHMGYCDLSALVLMISGCHGGLVPACHDGGSSLLGTGQPCCQGTVGFLCFWRDWSWAWTTVWLAEELGELMPWISASASLAWEPIVPCFSDDFTCVQISSTLGLFCLVSVFCPLVLLGVVVYRPSTLTTTLTIMHLEINGSWSCCIFLNL